MNTNDGGIVVLDTVLRPLTFRRLARIEKRKGKTENRKGRSHAGISPAAWCLTSRELKIEELIVN
jgi:hypothetical protein